LIEIEVRPHPIFTRKGDDIYVELPISLKEAVLGAKVTVPTPSGAVTMTVPKWTNTRRVLRLKGKGVPRPRRRAGRRARHPEGDAPRNARSQLEKLIAQWRPAGVDAPSGAMRV
jgi:DnaJ-class molecular chaperone